MSWEGGVDLVAVTDPGLSQPNVIVHLARMVHTPAGSVASGMIFWQPDPAGAPAFAGFVSTDAKVGSYFGPKIFAGTPFEQAPAHEAAIAINARLPGSVTARVEAAGMVFETEMTNLGAMELVDRPPSAMPPFAQRVVEAVAGAATLKVNGQAVPITIPPIGISGGPAAVWAPTGIYAR